MRFKYFLLPLCLIFYFIFYQSSILNNSSDIFYDLSILDVLLTQPQCSLLVADEHYANNTNDEMVVFANNQTVYKVEKGPHKMQNAVGEVVGINLFLNPSF